MLVPVQYSTVQYRVQYSTVFGVAIYSTVQHSGRLRRSGSARCEV